MTPLLSVVCLTGPHRQRTRRCLDALGSQTAAAELELILLDAGDPADLPDLPPSLAARIERLPGGVSFGAARRQGVAATSAPAIAFISDHCYPDPGWAGALIDAYEGPWAAVGYTFRDSAGATYGARAAKIADHGRWLAGVAANGPADAISYGEASYRRDFIEGLGEAMEWTLDSDFSLQSRVHQRARERIAQLPQQPSGGCPAPGRICNHGAAGRLRARRPTCRSRPPDRPAGA
jgi:Glycosyl transferase family 2